MLAASLDDGLLIPRDRCTCIGAGHDLATAQQLAGHASPTTTAHYDRRGGRARARATADLRFPLPGGGDAAEEARAGAPGTDNRLHGE